MNDLCIVDATPIERLPEIFSVLNKPATKFNATAQVHFERTLKLYVRLSSNIVCRARKVDLVIATVDNMGGTHGRGTLKRLLGLLEPNYSVSFESVINPRLVRCLRERGYQPWPELALNEWEVEHWIRPKTT